MDVTIDATSIKTFDTRLDAIVKGERFFNVEKFPTMTFVSSKLTFDGDRPVAADGELTMMGVTKPVNLKIIDFVCGENPFNKKAMCGADATATIKRSDFGLTDGLKIGNPSDEIKLTIPVEACKGSQLARGTVRQPGTRKPPSRRTAPAVSSELTSFRAKSRQAFPGKSAR